MDPDDHLVAVIDYDPSGAIAAFTGGDATELACYLKQLLEPAKGHIEASQANFCGAVGELFQLAWRKGVRTDTHVIRSILSLFSVLVRELERINGKWKGQGLAPALLRGGVSQGAIEFGRGGFFGPGLDKASACAECARKVNGILAVDPTIFDGQAALLREFKHELINEGSTGYIVLREPALLQVANR